MSALLLILLSAVLVCHYAPGLAGMRVFERVEGFDSTVGIAVATIIVLMIAAPMSYVLEHQILVRFDLRYLRTFALITLIMTLAQFVAAAMSRSGRWKPVRPMFTMLMTANCAVLGVALLAARSETLSDALWTGVGVGLVFGMMLLTFAALQRRLLQANVPGIFRDVPIALITVGLMALGLMGLTGILSD